VNTKRSAKNNRWHAAPATADADRRYAVEQAIARARNAQPWRERALPSDETVVPVHRQHIEENEE